MTTKLQKTLRREIEAERRAYVLSIDPHGLKLTEKGRRKGHQLSWEAIINGDAALASALQASLVAAPRPREAPARRAEQRAHGSRAASGAKRRRQK
jgi:hypothetical protein